MVEIKSKSGDFFVFDPDTELISKNGVIVPYSEYQPVYSRSSVEDDSIPPTFIGIINKIKNKFISISGTVCDLINNNNEVDI